MYADLADWQTNLVAVAPDKTIRCSALPMPPGRLYSNPVELQDVLAKRRFIVSGISVGGFSGERLISAAAPILGPNGTPIAAIVTGIRASYLNSQFNAYQLPEGSQLALVDRRGNAVLGAGSEQWRLPAPETIVRSLATGQMEFQHEA